MLSLRVEKAALVLDDEAFAAIEEVADDGGEGFGALGVESVAGVVDEDELGIW